MVFDNEMPDLGDASLGELGGLNDFYKRNAEAETQAARAKGGVGTNKLDDSARDFSSKQLAVEGEIHDRLTGIHESRSERSQALDESFSATRADSPEQWASAPDRYDWPGIDTPRR